MYSKSILRLAVVALSVASVAHASWPDPGDQVQALKELIVKRQGPGNTAQATTTSSPSPSPTDDPTDTTDKPTQSPTKPTSSPTKTTSEDDETTSSPTSEATPETITTVITTTNTDGSPTTLETAILTTKTPGLNANNGNSSSMSTGTRNTIIGVVVGVGGAIVLGALALVAWRIWGRKKHAEENDNLMSYGGGYGGMEKSDAGSSAGASSANRNPFQQTLETYHAPTQVNPSANF